MLDMRTKAGRREEIRKQVRDCGGFSVFWITDPRRAKIATEMVDSGELMVTPRQYPWSDAALKEASDE